MMKKLLAVLLISTMAVTFAACGNDSKEVASTEAPKQEVQEEKEAPALVVEEEKQEVVDEEVSEAETEAANEDLWGTKKPISGVYYMNSKEYPMTFEYNSDGTYTSLIRDGSYDHITYYSVDGKVTKAETYNFYDNPEGELLHIEYYMFGVPFSSFVKTSKAFTGGLNDGAFGQLWDMCFEYDEKGNITSDFAVSYPLYQSILDGTSSTTIEQLFETNNAANFERDGEGRIICISNTFENHNKVCIDKTDISYEGNTITAIHSYYYPDEFDSIAREQGLTQFIDADKIVLNEHGLPIQHSMLDENGNEKITCKYEYDVYGSMISAGIENGRDTFRFEYDYGDGTVAPAAKNDTPDDTASATGGDKFVGRWVDKAGRDPSVYEFNGDGTGMVYIKSERLAFTYTYDDSYLVMDTEYGSDYFDIVGDTLQVDGFTLVRE